MPRTPAHLSLGLLLGKRSLHPSDTLGGSVARKVGEGLLMGSRSPGIMAPCGAVRVSTAVMKVSFMRLVAMVTAVSAMRESGKP